MHTLTLLIKPASGNCNMRCQYCFYSDVMDHRSVQDYGMMQFDILETIVQKAMAQAEKRCIFNFQGGEPTLVGLDYYKRLVGLVKKYNTNGVEVHYTLQTNGYDLEEDWFLFFKESNFLIGVSVDGPKSLHDQLRLDSGGRGTHKHCLRTIGFLRKYNVEFNILTVITQQLASRPDKVYQFFKQQGIRYAQLIPCLGQLERPEEKSPYPLQAKTYGKFLIRIFDLWYQDFLNGDYVSIRIFENYIQMLAGFPPESCSMNGVCSVCAVVEANGNVYPCDFYALDQFLLGNIRDKDFDALLSCDAAKKFVEPSQMVDEECGDCAYFSLCRGGCRRDREPIINGVLSKNRYCDAYKAFFEHALPKMKHVAKQLCKN